MGYRPTRRELELSRPGVCTTCGRYAGDGRNTAGQCLDCPNRSVQERRAARKAEIEAAKERGRRFWAERGIRVGDAVEYYAPSLIAGAVRYVGRAKVGASGAYVYVRGLGRFRPEGGGRSAGDGGPFCGRWRHMRLC